MVEKRGQYYKSYRDYMDNKGILLKKLYADKFNKVDINIIWKTKLSI